MKRIKKKKYPSGLFLFSGVVLILVMLAAANFGAASISPLDIAKILLSRLPFMGHLISLRGLDESTIIIVAKLRVPRILLGALAGAGLSVVGAAFQGVFKNPMADPFVLGISSGAALGATLSILFGGSMSIGGMSATTIAAFCGAVATTICVYSLARIGNRVQSVTLLLSGVALSYLLSSLISLLMLFHRESIERIILWTMGNLSGATMGEVLLLLLLMIPCLIGIWYHSRDLNLLLLGDESAKSLGVDVEQVKKRILLFSTLIVAGVVSFSGIIGFVGLIIPHTARMLVGPDHKILIPFAAVFGSVFMILCDTAARSVIPPAEVPVGIITSLLGVPFFLYLLYKSKRKVF